MTTLLFIGGLGGWEILLIVTIILIFFGAKKIPELARGLGTGMREFKNATKEIKDEVERDNHQEPKQTVTTPPTEASKIETGDQNK
ncbi:Sec-independent protein translocase subunit TatA/TatB [Tunicatimonas pelagia]|uniref:Sec-independent protein translocase subunit TatA/TatB n=1 Tax=Tunicatimonas pelagia TaxID=931531 RepID=UPI0026670BA2|nr:twin-arginine translocase TatA/TatE family subunit [Tunicatimonas pelagia]WKN41553.1 twin-arginine translocase TatA/TatE family subunit [Tunicatimonas pelagia]